jgi:DNA invertase Pin-like site-specific DNA recombinase
MLIGYARVSTGEQDPALQIRALKAAGVKRIAQEAAGGTADRPELEKLLSALKPGDVLMAYKVDRLARSLYDLMRVLRTVEAAGATFRSLTEPIETTTPAGRMMVQMLGAFAEFERAIIRERCMAGLQVAKDRGVKLGRPRVLDDQMRAEVANLRAQGWTVQAIADANEVHRATVERILGTRPMNRPRKATAAKDCDLKRAHSTDRGHPFQADRGQCSG